MSAKRRLMTSALCAALCTALASCATTGGTTKKKAESGARTPVVSQLQYKVGDDLQKEFGYMGGSTAKLSPSPPQKPVKQPAFSSKQPLYGEIVLGAENSGNRFLFAWDESKGTGSGYDTFYVDAKKSKDLTEALKVAAKPGEKGNQMGEFPVMELSVSSGAETHPYHVRLTRCGTSTDHIHLYSAGYCEGTLALGKQTLKVALFDGNGNGLFNDVADVPKSMGRTGAIYCAGDEFLMDTNGDGKLKQSPNDTSEVFPVAKFLSWGKACYELNVAPDGRSISVQETTAPCGNLAVVGPATFSAQLLGDAGAMKIANSQGKVKVPEGKYRLASCDIQASDKDGKVWHAAGRGEWSQQPIEIIAKKGTKIALGPPLTAEVKVTKQSPSVKFDLAISGKGGEKYSATSVSAVDSRQAPPPKAKLQVRDANGKVVASADFEYG